MRTKRVDDDPLAMSRARRKRRKKRERIFKYVLLGITAAIIIAAVWFVYSMVMENVSRVYNPGQDPTYSFELTQEVMFRTATATPTLSPTPTETPAPSETPSPTVSLTPTLSPTPKLRPRKTVEGSAADLLALAEATMTAKHVLEGSNEPISDVWFELYGNIATFDAAEVYPNNNCSWMGVAGVLVDKRGEPQVGYYVQVGYADGSFTETLSGLFPGYGSSGYEITLARPVQAFEKPIWIRVLDPKRAQASEKVYFKPSSDCAKSLIMINFQRIR